MDAPRQPARTTELPGARNLDPQEWIRGPEQELSATGLTCGTEPGSHLRAPLPIGFLPPLRLGPGSRPVPLSEIDPTHRHYQDRSPPRDSPGGYGVRTPSTGPGEGRTESSS